MKKIRRIILAIAIVLLIADFMYVVSSLESMNILNFLAFVILIPCILVSVIISCIIAEMSFYEPVKQGIATGIICALLSVTAYAVANQNHQCIERIIENTNRMETSTNLSISDISISNGVSSYIFIFVFVFVVTMGFNLIFNALYLKEEKECT